MATTYKTFLNNDVTTTRTLLHESVPVTGTIVSGTYGAFQSESNIKTYSHGMFQSVYDYPHLSSSANHIFDIAAGFSSTSEMSQSSPGSSTKQEQKINIYNQMAQMLVGHDVSGSIREFDQDGDLGSGTKLTECFFIPFSRLLVKDEIKKGSFLIKLMTGATFDAPNTGTEVITLQDHNAANDFRVNSPAGEYGLLLSSSTAATDTALGLIYYQAGVCVLTASVFDSGSAASALGSAIDLTSSVMTDASVSGGGNVVQTLTGSNIDAMSHAIRHRIDNISFNNTTELNSTIYFCRANHNEFNYSSNPTYVNSSKIRVKNVSTDAPVTYMTTVGLYSADNELLAVAKLSEPLKKTPENEVTLRVRLDY